MCTVFLFLYHYRYIVIVVIIIIAIIITTCSPWKLVRLGELEFLYSDMWIG